MNKLPNLVEFCQRKGIFKICQSSNKVTFGPYGQLLLKQIQKEWLRANLYKFTHNFLIASTNLTNEKFDSDFFVENLKNNFQVSQLPVGLLNIHSTNVSVKPKNFDQFYSQNPLEENFLIKELHKNSLATLTHLNAYHFYSTEFLESIKLSDVEMNSMLSGPLLFWQRERKNWWIKMFNFPEKVTLEHTTPNEESIDKIEISYQLPNESFKYLESIQHFTSLSSSNTHLQSLLNSKDKSTNFLVNDTKQMIVTQTTSENVLENILADSVQYRCSKAEVLNRPEISEKEKIVFRLDYKLAPFKACILYDAASLTEATDLKKQFFYSQIEVCMMLYSSGECGLEEKYEHLDEMGVPFSIHLSSNLAKDGICFIRNRETTLIEHLHISMIVKQFRSLSNALCF